MNDLEKSGNQIEAALWFVVTAVLLVKAAKAEAALRKIFFVLSGTFFVFGMSDIIEAQTGAWWRPLWLLFMKVGCIVVFFFGFRAYYRVTKRKE